MARRVELNTLIVQCYREDLDFDHGPTACGSRERLRLLGGDGGERVAVGDGRMRRVRAKPEIQLVSNRSAD